MLPRALALNALLAGLVGLLLLVLPPAAPERWSVGLQAAWAPSPAPADGLRLALAAADAEGRPLDRHALAQQITALRQGGARAVVVDLDLSAPGAGDADLAAALHAPGAPVVLTARAELKRRHFAPVQTDATADHAALNWPAFRLPQPALVQAPAPATTPPLRVALRNQALSPWEGLGLHHLEHRSPDGTTLPSVAWATLQALGETLPQGMDGTRPLVLQHPPLTVREPLRLDADQPQATQAAPGRIVVLGASQGDAESLAQDIAALRQGNALQAPEAGLQLALLGLGLAPSLFAVLRRRTHIPAALLMACGLSLVALGLMLWAPRHGLWIDPLPLLAAAWVGAVAHAVTDRVLHRTETQRAVREQALSAAAGETRTAFLSNVSHELRTPLSSVLGLTELLAQGPLTLVQRRQVQLLNQASHNLMGLVDDLLDLNRLEIGRLALAPSPQHLPELLQDVIARMQRRASDRGVRCEVEWEENLPPWVRVDGARLAQVLTNLLGNAIRFTPQGQVRLQVSVHEADARLQFTVIDTGIGIAASQLQRIFEPFVQTPDGEEGARYGGTGLGLSISRELVRLMGGEIEVHSVPGSGSRFSFHLALPTCEAPPDAPPSQPKPHTGLQVLLAEDDDVSAEVVTAQLAPLGVRVERAANGHLALALAQRLDFDALLLDLQMPGLDGHRVARAVRNHERDKNLPRVPILLLTAHSHSEDLRASLEAGCDAHLNKPVSQHRLLQALQLWAGLRVPEAALLPPTEALLAADEDPATRRRAHARVFLGRFGETWAAARQDRDKTQALVQDLVDCAEALQLDDLLRAATEMRELHTKPVVGLQHQLRVEASLRSAVETTLLQLSTNAYPGPAPAPSSTPAAKASPVQTSDMPVTPDTPA